MKDELEQKYVDIINAHKKGGKHRSKALDMFNELKLHEKEHFIDSMNYKNKECLNTLITLFKWSL